jgi:hypothetical protein
MSREIFRALIEQLNRDAERIAARFLLRYTSIDPERAGVRRRYGICYSDGRIRIRLRHAVTGEPLRYSSLVNTLCHELAHLRHFDHGPRFKAFYLEVLEHAREIGIYRPGERGALARRPAPSRLPARTDARTVPAGPLQLALFATSSKEAGGPEAGGRARRSPAAGRIPRGCWDPRSP